jgi:hypothetical protein
MQTKDWFFSVPVQILDDERLDPSEKMVYIVICSHASAAEKTAFPSAKTIGKKAGIGRTKVFACLNKLCDLGYIERKARFKVTIDEKSKQHKVSKDTNEYTLKLPSSPDDLVRNTNHLPSSRDDLVHETNYPPSSPREHRTIDFRFDLIDDDDKKIIHEICWNIFDDLKDKHEEHLTIEMVCEAMNRSLANQPDNIYGYVKKVVLTDLAEIQKTGRKKVSAKSLNIKKPRKSKPIRVEQEPAHFAENFKGREVSDEEVEEMRKSVEEKLKAMRSS